MTEYQIIATPTYGINPKRDPNPTTDLTYIYGSYGEDDRNPKPDLDPR